MRVLIVDDSRTMRNFLAAIVGDLSIESEQAADGIEGLERLEKSGPFEVALVDWDMPRMNGLAFVENVRARPQYAETKLMMVTARTGMQEISDAVRLGADDFLMKPLTPEMVADKFRILGLID